MADGRTSLCVEALQPVPGHVGIDGRAEVLLADHVDIWPVNRTIVEKYVGRGDPANDAAVEAFLANMAHRTPAAHPPHRRQLARYRHGGLRP